MDQDSGKKKWVLIFIIFLILLILFLGWLFLGTKTTTTSVTDTQNTGFDPFNRPVTNRNVDTRSPDVPYTQPTPVTDIPVAQQQAPAPQEPTIVNSVPAQEQFLSREPTYRQSFVIPSHDTPAPAPTVYSETPVSPATEVYTTYTVPTYKPLTAPSTTVSVLITNPQDDKKGFNDLDKEIFGYVSGLGWTQLLGDTGQKVFDFLYLLTPQGSTGATLGKLLGVGGGSSGGGGGIAGFGAGGSSVMNFGGRVNNVTYCTCSDAIMLDIADVRGQTMSLIYQAGASVLYSHYDVYSTGQNVLGNYVSGGACLVESGPDCDTEGNPQGTITQIGTSQ